MVFIRPPELALAPDLEHGQPRKMLFTRYRKALVPRREPQGQQGAPRGVRWAAAEHAQTRTGAL